MNKELRANAKRWIERTLTAHGAALRSDRAKLANEIEHCCEEWGVPVEAAIEWIPRHAWKFSAIKAEDFEIWARSYDATRQQIIELRVKQMEPNSQD